MKKAIITVTLGLALAASAAAKTVRVDFDAEGVDTTYVTNTTDTPTLTASETLSLSSTNSDNKWFDSTTTFTLNLDRLKQALDKTDSAITLVTLTTSGDHTIGLAAKKIEGEYTFIFTAGTTEYNPASDQGIDMSLTGSGTYSLVTEYVSNAPQTYFLDSGTDTVGAKYWAGALKLGYSNDTSLSSVSVNSTYVSAFAVSDATLNTNANGVLAAASALQSEVAKNIPEPTTATLSLLALAGLAARRRRK